MRLRKDYTTRGGVAIKNFRKKVLTARGERGIVSRMETETQLTFREMRARTRGPDGFPLKQIALAHLLGITSTTLCLIEQGKREPGKSLRPRLIAELQKHTP